MRFGSGSNQDYVDASISHSNLTDTKGQIEAVWGSEWSGFYCVLKDLVAISFMPSGEMERHQLGVKTPCFRVVRFHSSVNISEREEGKTHLWYIWNNQKPCIARYKAL